MPASRIAADAERLARLEREARLLASLNHPNIAAIHGHEESAGESYLALELVEGETLAQWIARGPLPVDETLQVCRQIAEGLEAAHEKGIVHRDLKPANIKITPEGKVKILDFGLAKDFQAEPSTDDIAHSPTISKMTCPGVLEPKDFTKSADLLFSAWHYGDGPHLCQQPGFAGSCGCRRFAQVKALPCARNFELHICRMNTWG